MTKIGFPRALIYYQQYPLWRAFFEELGAEVVVSQTTSRGIVTSGSSLVATDTCLPAKIYCGHAAALGPKVDFLFIPSVKSIEPKVYNCPKFVGLPDLVRQTGVGLPPILDIDIDVNLGMRKLREEVNRLGKHFTRHTQTIDRAMDRALAVDREYQEIMRRGLTPPEAIGQLFPDQPYQSSSVRTSSTVTWTHRPLVVALIGHPYNIHDEYVNHNLVGRLRAMNVKLVTPEMAPIDGLNRGISTLVDKPYYTYEREVVGAGGYYLDGDEVDGAISIAAFGCGPDSMMVNVVTRAAKRRFQKPLMNITIDEHTGEAGLVTRLEAFADNLQRRMVREVPSGEAEELAAGALSI